MIINIIVIIFIIILISTSAVTDFHTNPQTSILHYFYIEVCVLTIDLSIYLYMSMILTYIEVCDICGENKKCNIFDFLSTF